jgi:hypothetical protein
VCLHSDAAHGISLDQMRIDLTLVPDQAARRPPDRGLGRRLPSNPPPKNLYGSLDVPPSCRSFAESGQHTDICSLAISQPASSPTNDVDNIATSSKYNYQLGGREFKSSGAPFCRREARANSGLFNRRCRPKFFYPIFNGFYYTRHRASSLASSGNGALNPYV